MAAKPSIIPVAFLMLIVMLVAACGGDDESPSASASPSPSPTSTKPTNPPTRTPGRPVPPREVAGIEFYTWDSWIAMGLGSCPSQNPEGPYLGPAVFSVAEEDLPDIAIPAGHEVADVRMCKLGGITVLNYILDPDFHIELVAGPQQWASLVPLDELSVVSTAVGDVVVAPQPSGYPGGTGATAVHSAPFGLVVANGGSEDDAIAAATAIDAADVQVPLGKDIFAGDINGIHFWNVLGGQIPHCSYTQYGFEEAHGIAEPTDPRLKIEPGYVPAGAHPLQTIGYRQCDGVESAEVSYYFGATTPGQYWIVRKSGTPEWYSTYSEDWYSATTVAGLDAVLVAAPPGLDGDSGVELFVREAFGMTAIYGPDATELVKIAEGLNR